MNAAKFLIVEDEPKVAGFIKKGLEEYSFQADIASDGTLGATMAMDKNYDGLILDVNLPNVSGFEICKKVRENNIKTPILMLTAMGAMDDKLTGFELGADDYLVKPFEFQELLARLKALIKRSKANPAIDNILKIADLELNVFNKTVTRANKKIDLTAKEYALLEYLLLNQGRVVSKSEITEKVWDITFNTGTNVIEVYINFLRKKIDKDFSPKLIHTQIGMGYVLKEAGE